MSHIYLKLTFQGRVETVTTEKVLTLDQLQNHVGGLIEVVRVEPDSNLWVIMNEEGKLIPLPANPFMPEHNGNLLFARQEDEELVGLFPQQVRLIKRLVTNTRHLEN